MPVAGLRQIVMRYTLGNGDIAVNVMHVKLDLPDIITPVEAAALADIFKVEFFDEFKSSIVSGTVLQEIEVRDASGETGLAYTTTYAAPGTGANTPLPYQVAAVVSWRTGVAGKSFRGRSYIAGWNEAGNSATGRIDAAVVTDLKDAAENLVAALQAVDTPLVIYSRKLDVATPVTSVQVDNRWDIQRRRDNV